MIFVKVAPGILGRFPVVGQRISSHRRHDGDVEIRKEVFSAVLLAETVLREIAPVSNDGFILFVRQKNSGFFPRTSIPTGSDSDVLRR